MPDNRLPDVWHTLGTYASGEHEPADGIVVHFTHHHHTRCSLTQIHQPRQRGSEAEAAAIGVALWDTHSVHTHFSNAENRADSTSGVCARIPCSLSPTRARCNNRCRAPGGGGLLCLLLARSKCLICVTDVPVVPRVRVRPSMSHTATTTAQQRHKPCARPQKDPVQ